MNNNNQYFGELIKHKDWLTEQRGDIRQRKEENKNQNGEFKFQPPKTIEDQLEELATQCIQGHYDKKITIKGYKGTFKLEHWKMIELRLRSENSIRQLKFIDTKLEKENLMILPQWFKWTNAKDLIIELQQNELDDTCVEDFVWDLFTKEIDLNKLYIISNPGIYKGFLLRKLKRYLIQHQENNIGYYYHLIKNKQQHSIAIIKINRGWQVQRVISERNEALEKINQTFYFNFSLSNCFTQQNWRGCEYLFKCTYSEDNLEQISHLDISHNYLGSQNSFNSACQSLATAKGLVSLKIKEQQLINNTRAIEQLVGDRYERLRVNHLIIADNPNIVEKGFQLLSDHIFLECKALNLNNSLKGDFTTLFKLSVFCQAYEKQQNYFKSLLKNQQNNGKYKHKLQVLNLSSTDNYDRYDQVEYVLNTLILNQFSNIYKFILQDLDVGRTEALIRSLLKFKTNYNLKDEKFTLSLKHLKMFEQTYTMKIDVFKSFFVNFLFTQKGQVLEIEKFTFIRCFKEQNRKEGLKEACCYILEAIQKTKGLKYSIKYLKFYQSMMEMDLKTFKCFLLTQNLEIKSFKYFRDSLKGEGRMYLNSLEQYLNSTPENFIHSLQIFKLNSINDINFDIGRILKLFIYHPKLQLKEFELYKITLTKSQLTLSELNTYISENIDQQRIYMLKILKFGGFQGIGEIEFFKYIVFSKNFRLQTLKLKKIYINQFITQLEEIYQQIYLEKINTLSDLHSLKLNEVYVQSKEQWFKLSQMIIFNSIELKHIKFQTLQLDDNFQQGLGQSVLQYIQQQKNMKLQIYQLFDINTLQFVDCNCSGDFLSLFFPICQIKNLEFKKCIGLQESFYKIKTNVENYNLNDICYFSLESFKLIDCSLTDLTLFKWMISYIVLNIDRQKLQTLHLINCNLNDEMVAIIIEQLQLILKTKAIFKRVFLLRNINLSKNWQINELEWVNLFNTILNQHLSVQQTLRVQESLNQDMINLLIDENVEYIKQSLLGLQQKIFHCQRIFKPNFPKQLKHLELNMLFSKINNQQKQQLYQRILIGFVIHPESQLKTLILSNVDLDLFMQCSKRSLEFCQNYIELSSQSTQQLHFFKLEEIQIKYLTNQSKIAIEAFLATYLCSKYINLKKLSLYGFKEQFLQLLLDQIEIRNDYILENFILHDCEDKLNEQQSIKFLDYFIYNKKFPIKQLTICRGITFDLIKFIDINDITSKIIHFNIQIDDKGKNHLQTCNTMINCILSNNSKLQKLQITCQNVDSIFQSIYQQCQNQTINLVEIIINGSITINQDFFDFISKSKSTLMLLQIYKVIYQKQNDINYLLSQTYQEPKQKSKLDLKYIEHEGTYFLYNNLLFNKDFGFTDIILRDPQSFARLQINQNILKIRYLKLDMSLSYDSGEELECEALQLIGQKLIYNEDSVLEEIIFKNCQLRINTVKALVSSAQKFMDRIIDTGRTKSYYMNLKRFCIVDSLHISQEGLELLFRDLIYFQFINIERIELQVLNLNDKIIQSMTQYSDIWLHYQKKKNRQFNKVYPIKYLDIGKNQFIQDKIAWYTFLRTLIFTDKTPYLEILNLDYMSLTDQTVKYISHCSQKYFLYKSNNYHFPLKRLNFSKNNFLTEEGWKMICNNFIFHPNVYLEELNLTSTQIDTDEKLNIILDAAKKRASISKNKKLPLHTFLCFNVALKNDISQYLSKKPKNYQPPDDLPLSMDYKCKRFGLFDELPIHLGDQVEVLNKIIYQRKELVIPDHLNYSECFQFSKYHLNFVDHFLKILNDSYQQNDEIDLYLNLSTMDKLCELFRYAQSKPAKPYPYFLLFQPETFSFLKQQTNKIKKITLIQASFPTLEEISQFDVLIIWKQIKQNKINIDQIKFEYMLNDDLVENMLHNGYTERDIISLCRLIPPSKIRIQGTLSISALKGLYSILFDTYYFSFSIVDYQLDNFLNIGIGYGFREKAYRKSDSGKCSNYFRKLQYKFFNMFVSPTKKYVFNQHVIKLNNYLSTQSLPFFLLALTNLLFFGVAIVSPFFLIKFKDKHNVEQCQATDGLQQYYCYIAFCIISAAVEGYLYFSICNAIPEHIEQMEQAQQYDESQILINEYILNTGSIETNRISVGNSNFVKTSFKERYKKKVEKSYKSLLSRINKVGKSKIVTVSNRIITFGLSQLFKFDVFGDVTFILTLENCDYTALFYVTFIITVITQGMHFLYFIYLIIKRLLRSKKSTQLLSTQYINDFYSMGFQGRNAAISNLLDSIAPYNVSIIPNNQITRLLLPRQAGKSMSNLVKGYFLQFIFEDLPQIVIQTYFTVMQTWKFSGDLQVYTYLRIANSLITVVSSFFKFMSIRPTTLVQDDFDKLSDLKKKKYKETKKEYLENEKKLLTNYTELNSSPGNGQLSKLQDELNPLIEVQHF